MKTSLNAEIHRNEIWQRDSGKLWSFLSEAGEFRLGYPAVKVLLHPDNEGPLAPMTTSPILESELIEMIVQPQGNEPCAYVEARVSTRFLRVISGDIKASDREKIEKVVSESLLHSEKFPQACLLGSVSPAVSSEGGIDFEGTLEIAGRRRPVSFTLEMLSESEWEGRLRIRQTDFGIVPATAFLGALRSKDQVEMRIHLSLNGI